MMLGWALLFAVLALLAGFLGFMGAVVGGLWLVRAIWRSGRGRDHGEED